jgi:hypothetical protein
MQIIDKIVDFLDKNVKNTNLSLLSLIFVFLFVLPFFPEQIYKIFFEILIMGIFVLASLSAGKHLKRLFTAAAVIITIEVLSLILNMSYLFAISRIVTFSFLIWITFQLIFNVAQSKKVSILVLLEAINGYLLIGIAFSIIIVFIELISPGAFAIGANEYNKYEFINVAYYTFTTLTTLGYGDMLPVTSFAKSTSILISLTGQIYLTVMIGMLIGKMANSKNSD